MTPQELDQLVGIITSLRFKNPASEIARRLEMQACGEMLMLMPLKTGAATDPVLPGVDPAIARAVIIKIIHGRPGEGSQPFALKPLIVVL